MQRKEKSGRKGMCLLCLMLYYKTFAVIELDMVKVRDRFGGMGELRGKGRSTV